MQNYDSLGKIFRDFRINRSISLKQIADENISISQISRFERGETDISLARFLKLMENMHVVSSQYWNQIHGFTAEDARRDEEGLQTMRTLGRNMAWLLKAIENSDRSGIARPVQEENIHTNFIR